MEGFTPRKHRLGRKAEFSPAMLFLLLAALFVLSAVSLGCTSAGADDDDDDGDKLSSSTAEGETTPESGGSLYQRIGGQPAIVAFSNSVLDRAHADPQLARFFAGKNVGKTKRLLAQYLCLLTGGGCRYTGRDMYTTHMNMGITVSDFNLFVGHSVAALIELQVPDAEQQEILGKVAPLSSRIVTR